MYCPNCGTQIPDGAKFCPACGKPTSSDPAGATRQQPSPAATVERRRPEATAPRPPATPASPAYAEPAPSSAMPAYAPPQKGHGLRNAIIGIVAILVVAVVAISVVGPVFGGPNYVSPLDFSPEAQVKRAVNGYFEDLENFDLDATASGLGAFLGSDASAYLTSFLNQFNAYGIDFQEFYDAFFENFGWTITGVNVQGDAATCSVALTIPDFDSMNSQISDQVDFNSLTTDQQVDVVLDAMRSPTAPTTTQEITLDLVNANGTWTISYLANLTSWILQNLS